MVSEAWLGAADSFLARNGYRLDMTDAEIVEIGLAMADSQMNRAEVFAKVAEHIVEL